MSVTLLLQTNAGRLEQIGKDLAGLGRLTKDETSRPVHLLSPEMQAAHAAEFKRVQGLLANGSLGKAKAQFEPVFKRWGQAIIAFGEAVRSVAPPDGKK